MKTMLSHMQPIRKQIFWVSFLFQSATTTQYNTYFIDDDDNDDGGNKKKNENETRQQERTRTIAESVIQTNTCEINRNAIFIE